MTLVRGWLIFLCMALALGAHAAELKVLTAGAFKPVLLAMQPDFEARTGHRLKIDNDTAGALQRRISGGEPFDVVVSSPAFGGSNGIYLAQLFERWGLSAQLRPMSVLVPGGLVGPLPADIQNHTPYAAALSAGGAQVQAARDLVQALQSPGLRRILLR